MSGTNEERLYNLLPELYRRRDQANGEALRALMAVLEKQYKALQEDITIGYNNWFIETCDEWVLPYLAELVGMPGLSRKKKLFSTQRRQVANTIGYRCRKGTIATLEHVLRDATDWLALAAEEDQHLVATQHLATVLPDRGRTVDVRSVDAPAEIGEPYDRLNHAAHVSSELPVSASFGAFHPGHFDARGIDLYFWRLRSLRMTNCHPCRVVIPELLNFLNQARNEREIVQRLRDDPQFGQRSSRAYGVRSSLAAEILKKRDSLPNRRFESIDDVDDVLGVGTDTLHDMLASFPGFYTFHPSGVDLQLFNWPEYITRINQRAELLNMPFAFRRSDLAADLEEYAAYFGNRPEKIRPTNSRYYGPERGLNIAIWSAGDSQPELVPIPPGRVLSMDMSRWDSALASKVVRQDPNRWVAVIDVELGRLALLPNEQYPWINGGIRDEDIVVTYCYGFSTEMGGGPYHRESARWFSLKAPFHIDVAKGAAGSGGKQKPDCVSTIGEAVTYWNEEMDRWLGSSPAPKGIKGFIRILDNGTYDEKLKVRLPEGASLTIMADNGVRPVIGKDGLSIIACEGKGAQRKRELHLDGLFIQGGLQMDAPGRKKSAGGLSVMLEHCTLAKRDGPRLKPAGIEVKEDAATGLELDIAYSIVGPLVLPQGTEMLRVSHSIVDNGSGCAIAADSSGDQPGPAVCLERSTVFGKVHARKVSASDVVFTGPIIAPRPETAEQIQFSYVPHGSLTLTGEQHPAISSGIAPSFNSSQYGEPGYAQLSQDCAIEIRGGASDGFEMGAFHDLYQLQAEENLQEVLDEYLPAGLEPRIHYVT